MSVVIFLVELGVFSFAMFGTEIDLQVLMIAHFGFLAGFLLGHVP